MDEKKLFDTDVVFDEDYYKHMQQRRDDVREVDFLIRTLDLKLDDAILDVGMGNGRLLVELARRGYTNLTGIDASASMAHIAMRATEGYPIRILHEDVLTYRPNRQFDKMFCFFTGFGYYDDVTNERFLSNLSSLLRPNGLFLFDLTSRAAVSRMLTMNGVRTEGSTREENVSSFEEETHVFRMHSKTDDEQNSIHKDIHFAYRIYEPAEVDTLLNRYSLVPTARYGNYAGSPMTNESNRNIYVAKKLK